MALKKIGWALAPAAGRRPRWSKEHLSSDGVRTLCGLQRPPTEELFDYGEGRGSEECLPCFRAELGRAASELQAKGWDPRRDHFRPYYNGSTGEVGYLVDTGNTTLRLTLGLPDLPTSEGALSRLRPMLKTHDPGDYVVELDAVNHFE